MSIFVGQMLRVSIVLFASFIAPHVLASQAAPVTDDPEILGMTPVVFEYEVRHELAETGDSEAKLQLFLHVYENLPELDDRLSFALEQLEESASTGKINAQFMLGYIQVQGSVVPKDLTGALVWLTLAAESGHHRARFWTAEVHHLLYLQSQSKQQIAKQAEHAQQAEVWWTSVTEDPEAPPELVLEAQYSLAMHLIRISNLDEKGWQLLLDAACQGHERAISTLQRLKKLLIELEDKGYAEAKRLLEQMNSYQDTVDEPTGKPISNQQ